MVPPMSTQAITPDFIPADNSPDFIPAGTSTAPEQSNPFMRFIKGAASRYLGATLNAGPSSGTPATYGTPEWQQAEQAMYQRYKSGQAQPGLSDYLKASSLSNVPANLLNEAKNFNPIDTQKFDSGDVAGGLGSTAMNLILLRQAFKGGNLPVIGSPTQTAEIVQPLTGGTKVQPTSQQPVPSQAAPSNATLPNATYLQPEMRALLRPKIAPPSGEINKDVNTNVQDYFIQKMREQMNRQTVTGSAEQDAAIQRMNEYAKSPFDRATASGPVESPQFAYRTRDAGETGIMPNAKKTAQASVDPAKVQSYQEGRATAQNHPQEMVRIDLSKLDPSEYEVQPNGYVNFKSAVPESFIEKMGSKAINDMQPRVPTSDADMQNLLMQSLQMVKARASSVGKK